MKKGERVLCLKRQLSDIPGFRLTVILSTRYEYLSKKTLQGILFLTGLVCLFGFYIWARHFTLLG